MNDGLVKLEVEGKEEWVDSFLNLNKIPYLSIGSARIFKMNNESACYMTKCSSSYLTNDDIELYKREYGV
ncbi:hypothetical protein F485_gp426 [Aeromonas phage CC2]|uniref:Uncharacterized protein n=1 Tax=Aeromonas phage CC2 TaxID=1204516 RepID=I6WM48_9CAUD|nr:hypothetical protein F485_gp426 [Aeromonas phage CC2]AFN39298.1 hypothetical protein CC2_426 [Aeromonas phage CC2]